MKLDGRIRVSDLRLAGNPREHGQAEGMSKRRGTRNEHRSIAFWKPQASCIDLA